MNVVYGNESMIEISYFSIEIWFIVCPGATTGIILIFRAITLILDIILAWFWTCFIWIWIKRILYFINFVWLTRWLLLWLFLDIIIFIFFRVSFLFIWSFFSFIKKRFWNALFWFFFKTNMQIIFFILVVLII